MTTTSLHALWRDNPNPANAQHVLAHRERFANHAAPCRLAVLRSFTLEPAIPLVQAAALLEGIDLTVHLGGFNTYTQEVLDSASSLYEFNPEHVIIAVQTRDVAPELWSNFAELDGEEVKRAVERVCGHYESLVEAILSRCTANVIMHSLELPPMPAFGILDAQRENGQHRTIQEINYRLGGLARRYDGIYLLDYDGLITQHGRRRWYDERKWNSIRMPIQADCLPHLVNEWLRFLHPMTGTTCKVLVVDLDHTLWGGIVGEDGPRGVLLGPDYPGSSYLALHRAILDLCRRGIILGICSKNNEADAMEVLEQHPHSLLRPNHFAAARINWNDKVQNLRELSAELNIALDHMAFLDDNPREREWVRSQLPEVTVIEIPEDPLQYAHTLRASPVFERVSLSVEDQRRGRYYLERRQRNELRTSLTSVEDYLRDLQTEVRIEFANNDDVDRIAQLTQKTNQFNLTTKRYIAPQVVEMLDDPEWSILVLRVSDRFGDSGLVGVAFTHHDNHECVIDSLLLSCRVIGRTIETAFVATIAEYAVDKGASKLIGMFVPTAKNAAASDFYRDHQFMCIQGRKDYSLWEYDLTTGTIASPDWIDRKIVLD